MSHLTTALLLAPAILAASSLATASEAHGQQAPPSADAAPGWGFGLTAYPTAVKEGEDYTSVIAVADRGALHLEARFDYESIGARSAFVGWSFSGGEDVTWMVRPLLGGAWGTISATVPALEASVAWKDFDFYIEAEYVRDTKVQDDSYTYAWSELGYRPLPWLRTGLASQRTRIYGGGRDTQLGPFIQFTWKQLTIGGYWFNPASDDQVFTGSVGVTF